MELFCIWTDKGYLLGFNNQTGEPIYGYGDDVKFYPEVLADSIMEKLLLLHTEEHQFVNVVSEQDTIWGK